VADTALHWGELERPSIMKDAMPGTTTTEHGKSSGPLEVELEPATLGALLAPNAAGQPARDWTPAADPDRSEAAPSAHGSTRSAPALEGHRSYAARVALSLTAAFVLALVGVVAYGSLYPKLPARHSVPPIARSAAADEPPAPAAPAPAAVPVRFVNPFDRTEVFEFPPGTSSSEARSAVAVILMDRARSRVRQLPRVATLHHKRGTAS